MTVDLQSLKRCNDGWFTTTTPTRIQILLAGTDTGPDPSARALAERILPKADHFIAEGSAYLRYFISSSHIGCRGDWEAAGFQFGTGQSFPGAEFTVQFGMPDDDIYGLWTVGYHDPGGKDGPTPFAFARMQF